MQVNNAQIKTQTSIEFQKDIRHSHCDSKNSRGNQTKTLTKPNKSNQHKTNKIWLPIKT